MLLPTKIKQLVASHKVELLKVLGLFVSWRLIVWLIAFISSNRFNLEKDQAHAWIVDHPWLPEAPSWLSYFARWDSGWYVSIASRGYFYFGPEELSNVVFFPLYPLLMKAVSFVTGGNLVIAGIIVSNLALLLACFFLYFLAKKELKKKSLALTSVFFLLIFPYSFFFTSVYTEALFLLTVVASFYFARNKNWAAAAIFAGFASATRPTGIIMLVVLAFEYLASKNYKLKNIKADMAWLLLAPLGLLSYMTYLNFRFADPLLFSKAQEAWGRKTSLSVAGTVESLGSYLHDLIYPSTNLAYYISNAFDFIFFITFFGLSFYVFFRIRKSYGLFMFLSLLIPIITQSLISMGRFTAVLFPAFLVFAKISKKQPWGYALTMLLAMLSTIVIMLFVNSYWAG